MSVDPAEGVTVDFGPKGDAPRYGAGGWFTADDGQTWIDESVAPSRNIYTAALLPACASNTATRKEAPVANLARPRPINTTPQLGCLLRCRDPGRRHGHAYGLLGPHVPGLLPVVHR